MAYFVSQLADLGGFEGLAALVSATGIAISAVIWACRRDPEGPDDRADLRWPDLLAGLFGGRG